jgi:hypothetical protein
MITTSSSILQLSKTLALASLLTLGLQACGSNPAPLGESQQPITDEGSDEAENTACAGGVAAADASEGQCTITARGLCFASRQEACACAGCGLDECAIGESFPEQAFCPSSGGGSDPDRPVSDDPDAPVSSDPGDGVTGSPGSGTEPAQPGGGSDGSPGCGAPGQTEPAVPTTPVACEDGHAADADGRCDFVVGNACFDSAESACACAGCELGQCLVLESYPAQARCL